MSVGVLGQDSGPTFSTNVVAPVDPPAAGDPTLWLDASVPAMYAWDGDTLAWLDVTRAAGVIPIPVTVEGNDPALAAGGSALPVTFSGPDNGWTIFIDNTLLPPLAGTYAIVAGFAASGGVPTVAEVRLFTTLGSALQTVAYDAGGAVTTLPWVGELDPASGVGLYLDVLTGPATVQADWFIHAVRVG